MPCRDMPEQCPKAGWNNHIMLLKREENQEEQRSATATFMSNLADQQRLDNSNRSLGQKGGGPKDLNSEALKNERTVKVLKKMIIPVAILKNKMQAKIHSNEKEIEQSFDLLRSTMSLSAKQSIKDRRNELRLENEELKKSYKLLVALPDDLQLDLDGKIVQDGKDEVKIS